MASCKDCLHYDICGGFIPTDLDTDVFDYCRNGKTDEIPDIEERCSSFKNATDFVEVVRCGRCKHSKPINTKQSPFKYYKPECIMCYCEEAIGDEPMVYLPTHFCSFGERKDEGK